MPAIDTPVTLRPCPFCAYPVAASPMPFVLGEAAGKWGSVECGACGARGPDVRANYRNNPGEPWHANAARAWNQRQTELEL